MDNVMEAGEYYVGDLCYVMSDRWDEVCEKIITGDNVVAGKFALDDGTTFWVHTTAWGDGTYLANDGKRYSVDAGLIGCILTSAVAPESLNISCGHVHKFDKPFTPEYDNGTFVFGSLYIYTNPHDDDYDDYDYEDEYEYDDDYDDYDYEDEYEYDDDYDEDDRPFE